MAYSDNGVNYVWSKENSFKVLNKIKTLPNVKNLSTYDFSTLYTSLSDQQIKEKINGLIKWTFKRESKSYLVTNEHKSFFSDKLYDKVYKS